MRTIAMVIATAALVVQDAWVLNRFKARGNVPGITKEQLEKIQVKY